MRNGSSNRPNHCNPETPAALQVKTLKFIGQNKLNA